jgi:putrescine carbamoyltransferase
MVDHFLQAQDFSRADLLDIIELARLLKHADKLGACPKLMNGAALGTIYELPELKPDRYLALAIMRLGGHVIPANSVSAEGGTCGALFDHSRILSQLVDAIEVSTFDGQTLRELAKQSSVPVINGQTRDDHPAQALSDIMTMMQHSPKGKPLDELSLVFIGAPTNIFCSLMLASTRLGMRFLHVTPKPDQAPEAWQKLANDNCKTSGGSFSISDDPLASVKDAEFIYFGLPYSNASDENVEHGRVEFLTRFHINDRLLTMAPPHARVMHYLPTERRVEIAGTILDGPQSVIFHQVENRLYASMSILASFVYPRLSQPSSEIRAQAASDICRFISAQTEY